MVKKLTQPDKVLIGKRLQEVIKDKNMTNQDLALECGVAPGIISRYVRAKQRPEIDFLVQLVILTGVNASWLLTGKGGKFLKGGFEMEGGGEGRRKEDALYKRIDPLQESEEQFEVLRIYALKSWLKMQKINPEKMRMLEANEFYGSGYARFGDILFKVERRD